jgi:uncharacterized protein (UPF0333 family)
MNNKGQVGVWAYALMLGLVIIIIALAMAPAGKKFIDDAMNATQVENVSYEVWNETSMSAYTVVGEKEIIGLNCSSATLGMFDKGTCVIVDFGLVYFFGGLILIGGGIILARILF